MLLAWALPHVCFLKERHAKARVKSCRLLWKTLLLNPKFVRWQAVAIHSVSGNELDPYSEALLCMHVSHITVLSLGCTN